MKTSRKLIVALTMAAMLLTMLGTGIVSAAPSVATTAFPDVAADSKYAAAFDALAALGVYKGDDLGKANPSATITREEAAAVMVRLSGHEGAVKFASSITPKFKDAAKISSWAIGYVNVAVAAGIIKGDAEGTFRPQDPVSYAEIVAMLARVTGNDGGITGAWPLGYMLWAADNGVTDNVDAVASLPANRGDVAMMAYNALNNVTQYWAGSDKGFQDFTEGSYGQHKGWVKRDIVVNTVGSSINGDSNLTLADKVFLGGASSLSNLINSKVTAYFNADGKVAAIVVQKASNLVTGALKSTVTSSVKIDSTTYGIASPTTFYVNGDQVDNATYFNNATGLAAPGTVKTVTATLNSSNKVTDLRATIATWAGKLTKVDLADNSSENDVIVANGNNYDVSDAVLNLDGKSVSASDLATADKNFYDKYGEHLLVLVYPHFSNTGAPSTTAAARIDAFDTVVTGKVTGWGTDSTGPYIALDGKKYYQSDLTGADISSAKTFDATVALRLDDEGKAYGKLGSVSAVTSTYAQLDSVVTTNANGDVTATWKLADGTVVSKTYASGTGAPAAAKVGAMYSLSFSNGTISGASLWTDNGTDYTYQSSTDTAITVTSSSGTTTFALAKGVFVYDTDASDPSKADDMSLLSQGNTVHLFFDSNGYVVLIVKK